uniref:T-cell surface glycoprotein CD8 alpha chain n=1 Tax=Chrysemys picta bellii TaxID=8478 RepID=A0A8C3F6M7_CHRPI
LGRSPNYPSLSEGQRSKMSVKLRSGGSPLTLKAPVELECVISGPGLSDSGVSWMRQHRDSAPQFILFISSLGRVASTENGKPPARFDAKRESKNYTLTVKSFQEQDQGNYYCIVKHSQRLHFSSGIPLHLPGQHQPHPISAPSAWKGLGLSCDFYIWVPLTSACLLLLIALLATITVCQSNSQAREQHLNLKIVSDGDSTMTLGKLFRSSITCTVKIRPISRLNLFSFSFQPLDCVFL